MAASGDFRRRRPGNGLCRGRSSAPACSRGLRGQRVGRCLAPACSVLAIWSHKAFTNVAWGAYRYGAMPMDPPPDLATLSLAEIVRLAAEQKLPPVEKWNPAHCGHSGMRIGRDGTWFHEGSPIGRQEMVRLFSTVLRREPDGRHMLV